LRALAMAERPPILQEQRSSLNRRRPGLWITAGSVLQLIAAFLPHPEVFMATEPQAKIQAIAASQVGWNLQAILFPIAFLMVTVGFGLLIRTFSLKSARQAAGVATALSALAVLLWLPISVGRLQVGSTIQEVLRSYATGDPFSMDGGFGWAFWPYTFTTLLSILAMGLAFWAGRTKRLLGLGIAIACLLILVAFIPLMGDWPPLLSYVLTLVLGIALLLPRKKTSLNQTNE
ncbi:MAG: hypothetical protein KDC44_16375, partial [Phaeodactylibacter sp.]|nr:hypothetical protein [Phaeodactylibacter sp.]